MIKTALEILFLLDHKRIIKTTNSVKCKILFILMNSPVIGQLDYIERATRPQQYSKKHHYQKYGIKRPTKLQNEIIDAYTNLPDLNHKPQSKFSSKFVPSSVYLKSTFNLTFSHQGIQYAGQRRPNASQWNVEERP